MTRFLTLTLALAALLIVPTVGFSHAGEIHNYMGSVTELHQNGGFTMTTKEGPLFEVAVSKQTKFTFADGRAATAADLQIGSRVVARISKDGKTALTVRIAPKK